MEHHRNLQSGKKISNVAKKHLKLHELCNGPSKLCMAFDITKEHNKYSMCSYKGLWIEEDSEQNQFTVVSCPRIGIDSAGPEWSKKPLRFYILDNKSVSKIDKKAEAELKRNCT